ncbi:hypothetical protein FVEN_g2962 [Fusarium venenatum]|nr:hypothetical protein FVEN_g2962 [Fusarium venenatum]
MMQRPAVVHALEEAKEHLRCDRTVTATMPTSDPGHDLDNAFMIWKFATPPQFHDFNAELDGHKVSLSPILLPLPVAFWVCQQTRNLAQTLWRKLEYRGRGPAMTGAYSAFDPVCDCAYVCVGDVMGRYYGIEDCEISFFTPLNNIALSFDGGLCHMQNFPVLSDFSSEDREEPLNVYFLQYGLHEKPGNNIRRINMETDTRCSDEIPQHKIDQYNDAIDWIREMESLVGAESCPQVTLIEVLSDPAQSWRDILSLCLRRG